jgi:hypothetical protein
MTKSRLRVIRHSSFVIRHFPMFGSLVWQFIKWHKILGDAVAERWLDRPLPPPTPREKELERDLHTELAAESAVPSLPTWQKFRDQVRANFASFDPRTFLRWPIVRHAMCLTNSGAVVPEYLALRTSGQWSRFAPAVAESPAGHPLPFIYYPRSSGSLLHHCHHVMRFEQATGVRLAGLDVIVEFGGGYGSLCRLLHRLEFAGRYFIYDLPEFSALQRYFLRSLDLPVQPPGADPTQRGIHLLTDLDALRTALATVPAGARRGFIATWSLSESPVDLRDRFLPLVADFDCFLIAFQDRFYEVDNVAYFTAHERATADRVLWQKKKLRHIPGSNYLFGVRKRNDE